MPVNLSTTARIDTLMLSLERSLGKIEHLSRRVGTDPIGKAQHNSPGKAELSRELLRAQDTAQLIQSELSVAYWNFKGYDDPREEPE